MKLANYCREEQNKQCRLILPQEDVSKYEKIYFYSEFTKIVPLEIRRCSNVEYGGTAMTRNKYEPFTESYIEYLQPQIDIYKEFLREKYMLGVKSKNINNFLDSGYYRMRAGDEILPFPPTYHNKPFYIYDRDIVFDGVEDIIKKLIARHVRSINFVHPVFCKSLKDFFMFRKYQKVSKSNKYIFDFNTNILTLSNYIEKNRIELLSEIGGNTKVYIPFGGTKPTTKMYYLDLFEALNKLYCYWAKGIPMKLKYIEPAIGHYNSIETLSKIIGAWSFRSASNDYHVSILGCMKKAPKKREEEIELVQRLQSMFPEHADLFNQTWDNLKDRRIWRV